MFPSLILLRSRDTIFLYLKTGDKSSQHKHGLNFLPLAPVSCCPRVLLQCVKFNYCVIYLRLTPLQVLTFGDQSVSHDFSNVTR